MLMHKLPRDFYERDTVLVARELLGKYLVHGEFAGKIVEVEGYLGQQDLASHSSRGITKRTEVMYGPPGYAYVYLIYGMYHCMNVVTEAKGIGSAVLLRAIEPVKNITGRTQGPGLLTKAMHIDIRLNRHDLQSNDFFIAEGPPQLPFVIVEKPRIGIHFAQEWVEKPLRFYIKDNPFISKL